MKIYSSIAIILFSIGSLTGQSIGGSASIGTYMPKFTNTSSTEEVVNGKSYMNLGGIYHYNINDNSSVPVVIGYSNFSSEHDLGNGEILTQSANSLNIGAGYKYAFGSAGKTIRPLLSALLSYEALLNSNYYFDEIQNGELDWNSNAFLGIQAGVVLETGLNTKIELFAQYQLGLLNRVDAAKYGTYKDQVLGLGINVIFN